MPVRFASLAQLLQRDPIMMRSSMTVTTGVSRSLLQSAFLICVLLMLLLTGIRPAAAAGAIQQDSGADGLVSVEAENYDANVSQGGHSWTASYPSGYSGTSALQATPNNGTNNNSGYVSTSPRLDYVINFVKTGVHYVWIRGVGLTGDDDSLHVGLDGAATSTAERISNFATSVSWTDTTMSAALATINVTTAGTHTLNLWMREDGTQVDKVVLTTSSTYLPTNDGPAGRPSPRSGGTPDTSAPTVPQNVAASAISATQVNVSWSASTDLGGGVVAGYMVYRGGTLITPTAVSGTSYSDNSVAANTAYTYQVLAVDNAVPANQSGLSTPPASVTTPAGGGTGAIQQDSGADGLVSVEAENYDANVSQGGHSWTASYPSGYSGTSALQATPNNGTNNNSGYVSTSPRLDYVINFVKTGVHYVWIRGVGLTGDDDSLHVGLDGAATSTAERISNFATSVSWTDTTMSAALATINVTTAGTHTLNLWMREDGTQVDKIVLTTSSTYLPTNDGPAGPAPSPRSGGTPDTSAPTVPQNVAASAISATQVNVSWSASTDLGGGVVAGYMVYRGGTLITPTAVSGTSYSDNSVAANTAYTYQVLAVDNAVPANQSGLSTPPASVTTPAGGGTGAIQQDSGADGLVSVEAENYDANVSQGGHSWTASYPSGYSGTSALQATPNNGTNNNSGYVSTSPRLDYVINFVKTGVHYVWIRGVGLTGDDDSLHVGLDGAATSTAERISNFATSVSWTDTTMSAALATINVTTAGTHTLNLWMREDGTQVDKIVLTTSSTYLPTNDGPAGPAPSPRSSGTSPAAVPVANPLGGTYTGPVSVSLSTTTTGGSIYYTTNGSTPTASSTLYSGTPLNFAATTTLKAITIASGFTNSAVTTQVYTVQAATPAAAPVANPPGGSYIGSVSVSLSTATTGGSIYYTTNGSTPTASSTLYNGTPLNFAATTTLKAITIASGFTDSAVTTQNYSVSPGGGGGASFQQSSGANGLVEIEAEDYDANVSQGGHSWTPVYPLGFSGTAALEATPNNGATNSTGFVSTSPRLDYNVNFVRTGVHYVWIRGMGSTSSDDSLHVGLDGAAVASATHITNFDTGLSWSNALSGGAVATINVPSTGAHTLNLWMREDGMVVDKIVLTSNGAYTPLGAGTTLFSDDFNDGDAAGWTVVDNCIHATSAWAVVGNEYTQTGKCNGVTPEGAVVGSYARSNVPLPGNVDIQLRLRGQDPALDGVAGNDSSNWKYGAIGVLFGYQGDNNYYRFEMNALKGYRKLWRRQGGAFTELNTSPQSYTGGQWVTLRIVHQNGVLLVYMDGQQVLATQDGTYTNTRLALFCSGNSSCSFDDVVVKAAPATPLAGLNLPDGGVPTHASSEYFVDGDGTLDVAGFATQATGVGGIRFVVDEGSGGAQTQTDTTPPYTAQFSGLATGDHTVSAHLLDGSLAPLPAAEASVTLPQVGSQGVHLYGSGDSITLGWTDNLSSDDVSLDGRNTGGGYPPVLNNYLSSYNSGKPVTVWNDGNSGETTVEGAAHIAAVLARTPAVQAYLFGYGTNDSGGSMLLDSGLGLGPGDAGYPGSYKYYVQQYINAVTGAGKRVYLAKIPPYLSDAGRDATIQTYNQVIDELVTKLQTDHPTDYVNYVPPDFHTYFTAHPGELGSDGIHPTGTGYASMGRLWCNALNEQMGLTCIGGP